MTDGKVYPIRMLVTDSMMSALLLITGMLKIPSLIPGAEFQISAPFAVSLAKNLGFRRYLAIGVVASVCGFFLGVQNVVNIAVAMIYRMIVGVILTLFRDSDLAVAVSGPCGTLISRIVLAQALGADAWMLILYAAPGMAFTAVMAPFFIKAERRWGLQ